MTLYAGVDAHKEMCYGVVMDEDGEVFKEGAFENTTSGAELFFVGCGRTEAVIEAGYSWRPTYDRLEEVGVKVKLAHPYKVRAIAEARVKTDSVDAEILAHLLRADLIPESYVRPREVRELQDRARLIAELGRERSRMKSRIRAEHEKNGVTCTGNPFTKRGKRKLRLLEICSVDHYLAVLEALEKEIKTVEKRSGGGPRETRRPRY